MTALRLPPSTPFPVKVASVHSTVSSQLKKHQKLISYSYWEYQESSPAIDEKDNDNDKNNEFKTRNKVRVDLVGTFECPVDGVLSSIDVSVGDEILGQDTVVATVLEPCSHSIQYGGLCALCGKALDEEQDYSGYKYEDRAPISMSHGTNDLKVSKDEAEKVEERWTKSLIKERKLILVVDLDQTVIHATVDPTIGEWMKDTTNANYPSLKDVKTFALEEEQHFPASYKGPRPPPFKRSYYIKLRPGLQEFMDSVAPKYELHIYTMGTRAYAKSIATCIDPEGKYFADRILSRDESGSLTTKSLERLFPTDTSMVVIIDDRGDVWNWSEHLVKVVPFDFFVGIGDINSNFLPRQKSLLGPSKRRSSIEKLEEKLIEESSKTEVVQDDQQVVTVDEREASLEAQAEGRPMAKLQKDLDTMVKHTERLLYDDDDELVGLEMALSQIHKQFYEQFDKGSVPNVAKILPPMKKKIFDGLVFVFSGLLPLGSNLESESIILWVKSFGATVQSDVTLDTTHIIAKNPYTYKARLGKTMIKDCKIMHPDWLFHCMSSWILIPTSKYEVEFAVDRMLPQQEVDKYLEKMQQGEDLGGVSMEPVDKDEDDLLGGDMNWLDDEEEEEEEDDDDDDDEDDEDDDEDEGKDTLKRGLDDDSEEESKRQRVESDDELAAELLGDLDE